MIFFRFPFLPLAWVGSVARVESSSPPASPSLARIPTARRRHRPCRARRRCCSSRVRPRLHPPRSRHRLHPPRARRRRYPPHARRRCHPPRTRVSHHHSTDEKWNFSAAAVLDLLQRCLICRAKVTPSSNRGDGRRGLPRWRDGGIVTGRRYRRLPLEFLPCCCSCTTSYCSPTSMTRVLLHDKLLPGRRRIQ